VYKIYAKMLLTSTVFCYSYLSEVHGGTAAAVPPPFRPSDSVLCGSCPIVTLY